MNITLSNCNNIDCGVIQIKENILNIKYAINGTGKSTISKAIVTFLTDKQNGTQKLHELLPFKLLDVDGENPEVTGADGIASVRVFDEDYVNEIIFQPEELIKGSFDIFIRDANYDKGMKEIDLLVEEIKILLSEDKDIEDLINDFNLLSGSFGRPIRSGIHGSSSLSKAFKDGNKVENIPQGLELFEEYIRNPINYRWIKWQMDGKAFIDISENCPYCVTDIKTKKDTIKRVSDVYDPKIIENLNKIIEAFQRLNKYFSDDTKAIIEAFTKNVGAPTNDQETYLLEVREQIDRLKEKFVSAQKIGFSSLKDVDKIIDGLKNYYIDLNLFNHLKAESTKQKVDIVNASITKLLDKAGFLQGSINKQKTLIEKLVEENKKEINGFLRNAGYQYSVDLAEDGNGQHKLKLIHNDIRSEVSNVKTHLSFGERNAFSLVLFMYDALKSYPDIIILDDPISSFDKNKKYAIVDMLFRKEKYLKGKTVLLLTHDFDPIVDMMLHHPDRFAAPFAVFLENNNGVLIEKEILRSSIKTFIEINLENIESQPDVLKKLVYLRRLYEITKGMSFGYQVISNLLHKREALILIENGSERLMTSEEIDVGIKEIRERIPDFDYRIILDLVKNDKEMIKMYKSDDNNYEKLHMYRMIFNDKKELVGSDVIKKFINEAFHVENNYIYQLNPCAYQTVPQYIIEECNKHIDELGKSI